jgi:hypothetical protein
MRKAKNQVFENKVVSLGQLRSGMVGKKDVKNAT